MMLKAFTIQKKFFGLMTITVFLGVALMLLTYQTLQPVQSSFNQYVESAVQRHKLLLKMRAGFGYGGGIHVFKNYVLRGKAKYVGKFNASHQQVTEALQQYRKLPDLSPEEFQTLAAIEGVIENYARQLVHVRDMVAAGKTPREIDAAVKINDSPALKGFTVLQEYFEAMTTEHGQALDHHINGMLGKLAGLIVTMVTILLATLFILNISITRRIRTTVGAMTDIAHGEGDLTLRLDDSGKDEISMLATQFNAFVSKMAGLVGEISKTSQQLVSSMGVIARDAALTNQGVRNQQMELEQVATAMNEMSTTVNEVASSTSEAAEAAKQADQEAINGRKVVAQSVAAIDSLAKEVQSATGVMEKLRLDSEGISSVMDVIRGIAEQTNLLALNAAIEAARAGDQGRGFAVVADEVRTLASRTQDSTAEIQQMVEGLQSGVNEAMQAMEKSHSEAQTGVEETGRVQASLDALASIVTTINDLNMQIASATEEQSQVAQEIDLNIVNVSRVAGETAEGAHRTSNLADEMTGLVSGLQSVINQFKI